MRVPLAFLLCLSLASLAQAESNPRGEELAQLADKRLHGYGDSQATLTMTLISPRGETAVRELRVRNREFGADGDRTLMVFDTPRDLSGTALLTRSQPQGDDEQWLFLPAVKRVKQIGARNKSGPFMASEFAFEDVGTSYWQKSEHRYLRDETIDGLVCHVLERTPRDPYSGYSRQLVWLDRDQQLVRRIEFYDRKGSLLKTYSASGFQQYKGGNWRPADMLMINHQTGRQTRLSWRDYRFNQGLNADDFSQNALLRAK